MRASNRVLVALAMLAPGIAQAQPDVRWTARVRDGASDVPIGGAIVRALGPDTLSATSGPDGIVTLRLRNASEYQLEVRRLGFVPLRRRITSSTAERASAERDVTLPLDRVALALDEMVVTAARREQRLRDAVQSIEVINRSELERSGASDLASVLVEQTGIVLQGGHPAGAGAMLQGIGSERVLVLLDGQPMTGRLSGVFDISRIPVAMVERVEVVKGPQSTLYGTDAMGGVINIISRRASDATWDASVVGTAGSQARRDVSASLSHASHGMSAALDAGHRSTATTPGIESLNGALAERTDLSVRLRGALDSARTAEASLLVLDERQRWRTSTFYNFGDNRQYTGRLSGSWLAGRHRLTPTVSTSQYDHRSRASIEPQPFADDTGQRQIQRVYQAELLYNGRFGASGAQSLDVGTQVRRDETESARVPGGLRSLTVIEPFVQAELSAGALSFSPGVRLSSSDRWGERITSRLASRWRVNERLTLRASAGEGFRAPDFKELFMFFQNTSAGYAVYGNPDLRPESSRNLTVGSEWAGDRQYLRGSLFLNQFRDFIETRPITGPGEAPVYAYGNVDRGFTRGVELESGVAVRGMRAEASYAGLQTRDDATGGPLLGRPTHSARTSVNALLPLRVRTSVTALYTGRTPIERNDTTGAITSYREGYARVDLRLARTLGSRAPGARTIDLIVGVENLFDRRPASWAGYTGRQLYTTLSWNLQPSSRP